MRRTSFLPLMLAAAMLPSAVMAQKAKKERKPQNKKEVSVADFGAIPGDNTNDYEAFAKAAEYCRTHKVKRLTIPAGVYNISDADAEQQEQDALSGNMGLYPERKLFKPKTPFTAVLDLSGCRDLTVDADGATLLLSGWYQPVTLNRVKNFTLRGLTISYARLPYLEGIVISAGPNSFKMAYDVERFAHYTAHEIPGFPTYYSTSRQEFYYQNGSYLCRKAGPGVARIDSRNNPSIGDRCIVRAVTHWRPAIMINESENVSILGTTIHSQPGMGIVGHLTDNITVEGLRIVPPAGSMLSVDGGGLHFATCSGKITVKGCVFRGVGDDCIDVHDYFYEAKPAGERTYELFLGSNTDPHTLNLDYPAKGDTLKLVGLSKRFVDDDPYVVEEVDTSYADWRVKVKLSTAVADTSVLKNFRFTKVSRRPSVEITGNTFVSHNARALNLKFGSGIISGNFFSHSAACAIQMGPEPDYGESGTVDNVLIEKNTFESCGNSVRPDIASCISVIAPNFGSKCIHHGVAIRNNVMTTDKDKAIRVNLADGVEIYGNQCNIPTAFETHNCKTGKMHDPAGGMNSISME